MFVLADKICTFHGQQQHAATEMISHTSTTSITDDLELIQLRRATLSAIGARTHTPSSLDTGVTRANLSGLLEEEVALLQGQPSGNKDLVKMTCMVGESHTRRIGLLDPSAESHPPVPPKRLVDLHVARGLQR